MRRRPSPDHVRDWLVYNAQTGVFVWRKESRQGRPLIGKIAGSFHGKRGYSLIKLRGFRLIGAHRLAWIYVYGSIPEGLEIDHIDGNPSNNAIANLRLATSRQQKRNKRVQSNNRRGLKGAYYHACHKGKKWRSQIGLGNRMVFLGYFHTAEEAHAAYGAAAIEHFGEFARVA